MKFSRIISLFLCLVFLISMSLFPVNADENSENSKPTAEELMSKGDINGDGKINAKDYLIVKRIFLETYSVNNKQLFAADINKDGSITSIDYLMIKRHFYQTYNITPSVPKIQIPLTDDQIEEIKTDYIEYLKANVGEEHFESLTAEDIIIKKYYGPYSGGYALFISHRDVCFLNEIRTKFIAGYKFIFWDGQPLMVYKDSSFVEIKTAYESGMISKDDVYDLFWNFRPNRKLQQQGEAN